MTELLANKYGVPQSIVDQVAYRCDELVEFNRKTLAERSMIRDLMDGGLYGLSRLLGKNATDEALLPVANQFILANNRLAQKLGRAPDVRNDPPAHTDSERALKKAEKRTRIITSWDRACKLDAFQLPQAARWLPGYGFIVWVIKMGYEAAQPYPKMELRNSYNAFPGQVGADGQPEDLAFSYRMTREKLARKYPEAAGKLKQVEQGFGGHGVNSRRAISGFDHGSPSWGNQAGEGVTVYEYYNADGCWWILPDANYLLAYQPNPLESGPSFVYRQRFAFDGLHGQYNHAVGLLSGLARMNTLLIMATEDAINTETNVVGELAQGTYQRGRKAVNYFRTGSQVMKQSDRVPFEAFQNINLMDEQLRAQISYPISDDGRSPMSFVTGAGMEGVKGAVDLEVREYQTVLKDGLEEGDSKRFELAEKILGSRKLPMMGVVRGAPFSEEYTPKTDIAGHRLTRRVYGIMAGFDEPNKIIGGMNLMQGEIIDDDTVRENIDGIENPEKVKERIRAMKAERALMAALEMRAGDPQMADPAALAALVNMLPNGEMKRMFEEVFIPQEEEQVEQAGQEQLLAEMSAAGGGGGGGVPDVTTVLNQLTSGRDPAMGVQNVGRL